MPAIAALRRLSESIRNEALETTVSPSATPFRTWMRSPSGVPVHTMRGSKRPPACARNTYECSPAFTTASAGTDSALAPRADTRTRPYMPGRSMPSGLASTRRAFSVRVSLETVG